MEPKHIEDLTEMLAQLRMRLGEVKRQSDPFAGIVLDQMTEHVGAADALLCRLLNAQTRTVPTINTATLGDLIGVTEELCGGHSMAIADRAHRIVETVRNQILPSPKRG